MNPDWVTTRLSSVTEKIGSGATPRGGKSAYKTTGIPLIRSQNVYNNLFQSDGLAFIDDDQANGLSNVEVFPGDVLLNITGDSVARCTQAPAEFCPARVNQHVAIIRPEEAVLDARFLKYWMVSPRAQDWLLMLASAGATRKALTKGMIENLEIPLPPIYEQHAIARVLGALDDKIELNRQTNKTLEQIAQRLFNSWFVDFDPVKAKMEGRQPAFMDAETAALFPDRLVETGVRAMPRGWQSTCVYDSAKFINGSAFKSKDFSPDQEGLPIIKITELKSGISEKTKFTEGGFGNKYKIADGEILYSWSGSPETSLEVFRWFGGEGWLNQHIFRVVTDSPEQEVFVYNLLKYLRPRLISIATNKQTTGLGHVTVKDLKEEMITVPPKDVLDAFGKVAVPLHSRVAECLKENTTLVQLRDRLLPKLISGEIRIKDAEKQVAEAV